MATEKKQIPLRLSEQLYAQIASWAEDDFRSVNGQIEYILSESLKHRIAVPASAADSSAFPLNIHVQNPSGL